MIPAISEVLTKKNFHSIAETDPAYANLLRIELTYCRHHEDQIIKKAKQVYNIKVGETNRYAKNCCNFKLLEEHYREYEPEGGNK